MSAILRRQKLAYVSAPKCACTSIKELIFTLENKRNFNNFRDKRGAINFTINGEVKYIHFFYPTINFKDQPKETLANLTTFCVVRDPIERIVSCHENRVVRYRELCQEQLDKSNIDAKPDPSLSEFILNLRTYRKVHTINHHTQSLTEYLGSNTEIYNHIYNLKNISQLADLLQHFFKQEIYIPHQQSNGKRIDPYKLKSKEEAKYLEEMYQEDYYVYGNYF